jgi:hypothetical protein
MIKKQILISHVLMVGENHLTFPKWFDRYQKDWFKS